MGGEIFIWGQSFIRGSRISYREGHDMLQRNNNKHCPFISHSLPAGLTSTCTYNQPEITSLHIMGNLSQRRKKMGEIW